VEQECGLGSGTNNYQEVKVFVDFDEISLRRRTEGSFLYCDSDGFLFTGGMTKFEVDIKYLNNKQMWAVKPCVWHLQFCGSVEGFLGCDIIVPAT
jgi:hypothetical protein